MNLSTVQPIANELVDLLKPHSEIINIAGSIRREKPEVKDIEIVCLPKRGQQGSLFPEITESKCFNSDAIKSAINKLPGKINHGNTSGRNLRMELESGITLDLFMPQKHDYYRQLATRTGSSEYSKTIAYAWNRLGWVGTPDGLRIREECSESDSGRKDWKCYTLNPTLPPVWQSEEEFFDWIKVKCIKPQDR